MIYQIIGGLIVLIISFFVGYFLSMSQRKEALRVELYRRKLDIYDKVMEYLQKIDKLILAKQGQIEAEQGKIMANEIKEFTYSKRHYLSKEIYFMLEFELADAIGSLPDSLTDLEKATNKIATFIQKEIGTELIASSEVMNITGQKKEE